MSSLLTRAAVCYSLLFTIGSIKASDDPCHCDQVLRDGLFNKYDVTQKKDLVQMLKSKYESGQLTEAKHNQNNSGSTDAGGSYDGIGATFGSKNSNSTDDYNKAISHIKSGNSQDVTDDDLTVISMRTADAHVTEAWLACRLNCPGNPMGGGIRLMSGNPWSVGSQFVVVVSLNHATQYDPQELTIEDSDYSGVAPVGADKFAKGTKVNAYAGRVCTFRRTSDDEASITVSMPGVPPYHLALPRIERAPSFPSVAQSALQTVSAASTGIDWGHYRSVYVRHVASQGPQFEEWVDQYFRAISNIESLEQQRIMVANSSAPDMANHLTFLDKQLAGMRQYGGWAPGAPSIWQQLLQDTARIAAALKTANDESARVLACTDLPAQQRERLEAAHVAVAKHVGTFEATIQIARGTTSPGYVLPPDQFRELTEFDPGAAVNEVKDSLTTCLSVSASPTNPQP